MSAKAVPWVAERMNAGHHAHAASIGAGLVSLQDIALLGLHTHWWNVRAARKEETQRLPRL